MAKSLPAIAQAGPVVTALLAERGLALHPEKTRLVHRAEGFEFLGFRVQMRGQKLLITPQSQTGHARLRDVRSWLKHHQTVPPEAVIRHLNPLLRGWARYDRHGVSKHAFQKVDDHIRRALWRWATRRHPRKSPRWISRRDFEVGQYGATFYAESRDRRGQTIRLRRERVPAIPIVRHVQVKGGASPDDPTLNAYWDHRRLKRGRQRVATGSLLYGIAEARRWQGPGCGQALFDGQAVHLHHRIPVHAGGTDARANLQGLQPVITNDTNKASLPANRLERHAGKRARAVLRGGGDGDTASLRDCCLLTRRGERLPVSRSLGVSDRDRVGPPRPERRLGGPEPHGAPRGGAG